MFVCPICYREVKQSDAAFCPWCGSTLPLRHRPAESESEWEPEAASEPVMVPDVVTEAVPETVRSTWPMPASPPVTPAPPPAPVPPTEPAAAAVQRAVTDRNRLVAYVALGGGLVAVGSVFLTWIRIRIDGFAAPGSSEIGWADSGGKAVVVAGAVAIVVAIGLLIGRRDVWLKMALLVAGGSSLIIAVVNMADAQSKADEIHAEFGIPETDVTAQIGDGLYLTAAAGVALTAAGLLGKPDQTSA